MRPIYLSVHSANTDMFCLYFWRSATAPGALYMAKDLQVAQAICAALAEEGYLVKAVKPGADLEYRMTEGQLVPVRVGTIQTSYERAETF